MPCRIHENQTGPHRESQSDGSLPKCWNMFIHSANVEPSISPPFGDELHPPVRKRLPVVTRCVREEWFTQSQSMGLTHFSLRTETSKFMWDELYQFDRDGGQKTIGMPDPKNDKERDPKYCKLLLNRREMCFADSILRHRSRTNGRKRISEATTRTELQIECSQGRTRRTTEGLNLTTEYEVQTD